jgi:hypothetical protein
MNAPIALRRSPRLSVMIGLVCMATGVTANAETVEARVVQCRSISQGEELEPRKKLGNIPRLAIADASRLAFYVSASHAVLAPRNWHCFENGGSSGSFLIIAPDEGAVLAPPKGGVVGPAVQVSVAYAGTSGRFSVAKIDAQLFPEKREFVQSVIDEGIAPASEFSKVPVPSDVITRIGQGVVEFDTPPEHDGLGTMSWLAKGPLFIHGAIVLDEVGEGDIVSVMIRLTPEEDGLAKIIASEIEARLKRDRF